MIQTQLNRLQYHSIIEILIQIKFVSMLNGSSDYHLTKRFKSTLANFHHYCHHNAEQDSPIKCLSSKTNRTLTKYCSLRQLEKCSQKHFLNSHQVKKKQNDHQKSVFQLKNSDLVQIIKLKLSNSQIMKTEPDKNQIKLSTQLKRSNHCDLNNIKFSQLKPHKTRKIQLIINNSKIKFTENPKTRREKYEQCVIKLSYRPSSAVDNIKKQIKPKFSPQKNSPPIKQKKNVIYYKKQRKQKHIEERYEKQKDISGWELPSYDEDIMTLESHKKSLKKVDKAQQ